MRKVKVGRVLLAALAAVGLCGGVASAQDDLVFRALGIYKGKENISESTITCEIPAQGTAYPDAAFDVGMWNTYGVQTLHFPDENSPAANPCGVWIQLQNNMLTLGINVQRVDLTLRIAGARNYAGFVPTRKKFPLACKRLRKQSLFVGTRLDPVSSPMAPNNSGAPNVAFVKLLPIAPEQLFWCLREQYGSLSTDVFASLPLIFSIRAVGIDDNGKRWTSNSVQYTLTVRHTCGNGRVDDGESCDPNAPAGCLLGSCSGTPGTPGFCGSTPVPCSSDADCMGTCLAPNQPSECTCSWNGFGF